MRIRTMITAVGLALAAVLTTVAASSTATAATAPAASTLRGVTQVTTAAGLTTTLLRSNIFPVPTVGTAFGFSAPAGGLAFTYGFPIVGGNPDLAGPSGDIFHTGGIDFTSFRQHLEIGKFDIALREAKIFATEVNFARSRIPVLDIDFSGLKVTTGAGATVLSGIKLFLDPAAAKAINSTFSVVLPTDGTLFFGTATITLRS